MGSEEETVLTLIGIAFPIVFFRVFLKTFIFNDFTFYRLGVGFVDICCINM